jgi:hypothetical protein
MNKITASLIIFLISMQCFCNTFRYDDLLLDDEDDSSELNNENLAAEKSNEVESEDASDFLKRTFFHPFKTKNEG